MDKKQWLDILGEAERTLYAPVDGETPIDGMTKQTAIRKIYKQIDKKIKGFFKDTGWKHVNDVWKEFDKMGLDWNTKGAEYQDRDEHNMPRSKRWDFEIRFTNKRGKQNTIGGYLTAAGAGSVDDYFSKYDITVVMY